MSEPKKLTNDLLKSKMTDAMVDRGYAFVLEECIQPGIYIVNGNSTTLETEIPSNLWRFGWLIVMNRAGDIHQRLVLVDAVAEYVRIRRNSVWKPWYRIEMTQVT